MNNLLTNLPLLATVLTGEVEEKAKNITNLISTVGTTVIGVAGAIALVLIVVNFIKSGLVLADADKTGPEQTAKAKTSIKNNVIALIIVAIAMVFFLTGLWTWIKDLIQNMLENTFNA